jgi:O-antigen ligase
MRLGGFGAPRLRLSVPPTALAILAALGLPPLIGSALAEGNWSILVLVGLIALVPLVLRWPVVTTFGLYAFLVPFDGVAGVGGGATLTRLVGMMTGVVLATVGLVERRLCRPPAAALWWGLLVLWAIIGAAWAVDPSVVIARLPTPLSLYFLYLAAVSFRVSRREFSWVCVLMVLGGVVAASLGYIFGFEEAEGKAGRGTLTVGDDAANPNSVAGALIVPLALAIGGFIGLPGLPARLLSVSALAIMGLGVFMTMSRGALVSVMAMIAAATYRLRAGWRVLLVAAVLLGLVATMPDAFFDRVSRVLPGGADPTGAGRTGIWAVGLAALARHWVLGAGLNNFGLAYNQIVVGPGRAAHNTYLVTWVELGLPGLVFLVAGVVAHFLAYPRRRDAGFGGRILRGTIDAACIGVLVGAFFGDRFWMKYFWLPWVLSTWAGRLAAQPRGEGRNAVHGRAASVGVQ